MSAKFLLDTNVLSEPLKPKPNQNVLDHLLVNDDALAVAAIVYHEMVFGYLDLPDSKRRRAIEAYIHQEIEKRLLILPYDQTTAKWHAAERARLKHMGKTPPFLDGQIAAVAATNNLTLVTRNTDDFQYFQDLKIVNWFE
ncbi:MAG: type II toxin-antitoxin system VapC family toxin [Cyanobacteria bacterium J06635_15]